MKWKINLNFKEIRDNDLRMLAYTVAHRMADNEYFPDPGMLVIELRELDQQFRHAITDARSRDSEKIAYKNNVRVLVIRKLKQVGEFVMNESKGREVALASSGFVLVKKEDEIKLKVPTDFTVKPGPNPGEIIMQVSRVKGARSYLYQWTPFPVTSESVWESVPDTRCKRTIKGLPLGVNYAFRMAVVGSRNQLLYTDCLNRYIS